MRLLRGMQRLVLKKASVREMVIGIDSTSFEQIKPVSTIHFEMADQKRLVRGAYAVGASFQLILGTRSSYSRY